LSLDWDSHFAGERISLSLFKKGQAVIRKEGGSIGGKENLVNNLLI